MGWRPYNRLEQNYARALKRMVSWVSQRATKAKTPKALEDLIERLAKEPVFEDYVQASVKRMMTQVKGANESSWREAARKSSRGNSIYKALKREMASGTGHAVASIMRENARLIRAVPGEVASELSRHILSAAQKGQRPAQMLPELRKKAPELAESHLKRIARTETSKASEALNQARSEALGINWYIWRTQKDGERVRASHKIMEGVLVRWADPPKPEEIEGIRSTLGRYHAGCAPNCRCYSEPVIDLNRLPDRVKVHSNGVIREMSKAYFIKNIAS